MYIPGGAAAQLRAHSRHVTSMRVGWKVQRGVSPWGEEGFSVENVFTVSNVAFKRRKNR